VAAQLAKKDYSEMPEQHDQPPIVEFTLDPTSPSKRPEQLITVLERTLQREFSEAFEIVDIQHTPGEPVVSIKGLEKLDTQIAKSLARRARVVFNDFMTSPWY